MHPEIEDGVISTGGLHKEYLTIIGWDHKRTKTIREKIKEMGIEDIAREIGS